MGGYDGVLSTCYFVLGVWEVARFSGLRWLFLFLVVVIVCFALGVATSMPVCLIASWIMVVAVLVSMWWESKLYILQGGKVRRVLGGGGDNTWHRAREGGAYERRVLRNQ